MAELRNVKTGDTYWQFSVGRDLWVRLVEQSPDQFFGSMRLRRPRPGPWGGAQMRGGKIAMPELVRTLSMLLDRSVIDRTGFTQLFDLQLDFVPDDTTPAMPPPPPDSGISGVSIAQALQQQLGLRLESTKGPVQVIVVDQAERPSAN